MNVSPSFSVVSDALSLSIPTKQCMHVMNAWFHVSSVADYRFFSSDTNYVSTRYYMLYERTSYTIRHRRRRRPSAVLSRFLFTLIQYNICNCKHRVSKSDDEMERTGMHARYSEKTGKLLDHFVVSQRSHVNLVYVFIVVVIIKGGMWAAAAVNCRLC